MKNYTQILILLALTVFFAVPQPAQSQDRYWAGGYDNGSNFVWTQDATGNGWDGSPIGPDRGWNWFGDPPNLPPYTAVFNSSIMGNQSPEVIVDGTIEIANIRIESGQYVFNSGILDFSGSPSTPTISSGNYSYDYHSYETGEVIIKSNIVAGSEGFTYRSGSAAFAWGFNSPGIMFEGAATYTGTTSVYGTSVRFHYMNGESKLDLNSGLNLGNAYVGFLNFSDSSAATQTVTGLKLESGASNITINTFDQDMTVNLGLISRTGAGATVLIETSSSGLGIAKATTTSTNTNGMLHAGILHSDGAGDLRFAGAAGNGDILGAAMVDNDLTDPAGNVNLTQNMALTGNATVNSLRIANASGATTLDIGTNRTLTLQSGGLLQTADATGKTTITGGAITASGAEIIIHNYSTQDLEIASALVGAKTAVFSGYSTAPSQTILSGQNTYTGGTVISNSSITLQQAAQLGTGSLQMTGFSTLTLNENAQVSSSVYIGADASVNIADQKVLSTQITQQSFIYGAVSGLGVLRKTGGGTLSVVENGSISTSVEILGGDLSSSAYGLQGPTLVTNGRLIIYGDAGLSNQVTLTESGILRHSLGVGVSMTDAILSTSAIAGGRPDTTANILAGTTNTGATLQASFSSNSSASNDSLRTSDVFHLSGVPIVSGQTTVLFVLDLSMTSVAPGSYLGWLNGSNLWVNAALGNTGNNASLAQEGYNGSFTAFQTAYGNTLASYVGAWGFTNERVWGVLNHNSDFAAVPEPSTAALLLLGAGALLFRRKRAAKLIQE